MRKSKLSIVVVMTLLSMIIWFSYWFDILWIDLQKELNDRYDEFREPDMLDDFTQSTAIWNIYERAYMNAKTTELASDKLTFHYMVSDLKSKNPTCNLTEEQVVTLFLNTIRGGILDEFVRLADLQKWKNLPEWDIDGTSEEWDEEITRRVDWCLEIIRCITPPSKNWQQKELEYTADALNLCTKTLYDYYTLEKMNIKSNSQLKQINYWNDMFWNGELKDSPYDILYDLEMVGKVLFSENRSPQKASFYGWWSWWWDLLRGDDYPDYPNYPMDWDGYYDGYEPYYNDTKNDWSKIDDYVELLKNWQLQPLSSSKSQDLWWWTESIFNWLSCTDPLNKDIVSSDQYADYNSSKKVYYENSTMDPQDYVNNQFDDYSPQELETYLDDFREVLYTNRYWSRNTEIDRFEQCMMQCDEVSYYDQLVCEAHCMCQISSWLDEIVEVKICLIPQRRKWLSSWREVMSVEDVINETDNAITMMEQSWELMPHKYTDERMETALQDIKLSRILAFDFVIMYKPLFQNTDNIRQMKIERRIERAYNIKRERNSFGDYRNLDLEQDRNRYIKIFEDPDQIECAKSPGVDVNTRSDNCSNVQNYDAEREVSVTDAVEDEEVSFNYLMMDVIRDWILDNGKMWDAFNKQLWNLRNTTRNFKDKEEATTP